MAMRKNTGTVVLRLHGEDGKKVLETIANRKPTQYNVKKQIKEGRKELRKQGFYM